MRVGAKLLRDGQIVNGQGDHISIITDLEFQPSDFSNEAGNLISEF